MLSYRSVVSRQVLMCGATVVAVWLFYSWGIAPIEMREAEFVRKRAELQEHLASASKVIHSFKDSDYEAAQARAVLVRLLGKKPEESAMVSFPEDAKQHFAQFGLHSAVVRLVTAWEEPKLPGFRKTYWSVGLPIPNTDRNVEGLLLAVAQFEQEDRYIKVTDFALQPDVSDPTVRAASVNIVVLDRK